MLARAVSRQQAQVHDLCFAELLTSLDSSTAQHKYMGQDSSTGQQALKTQVVAGAGKRDKRETGSFHLQTLE